MSGCKARERSVTKHQELKSEKADDTPQSLQKANAERNPQTIGTRAGPSWSASVEHFSTSSNVQVSHWQEINLWNAEGSVPVETNLTC